MVSLHHALQPDGPSGDHAAGRPCKRRPAAGRATGGAVSPGRGPALAGCDARITVRLERAHRRTEAMRWVQAAAFGVLLAGLAGVSAAAEKIVRIAPQSNLAILDPHWTTAT